MIMSNAIHVSNTHNTFDSPYITSPSVLEVKIPKDIYSLKSGQEIYELLKDDISIKSNELYPTSMIIDDIETEIQNILGYSVREINESLFTDDEGDFTVYTAFLDLEEKNYTKLLDEEWEISESLGLYEKNIILRFV